MTTFLVIVFLVIAAIGAGLWLRHVRARQIAERRAMEESERLAAEKIHADENAAAKARENARLLAEAEEQSRDEAVVREEERLAEEQCVAAEKLAAEAETKRRAEQTALAEAQAREATRIREETEARQRAEAETRERTQKTEEEEARLKAEAEAKQRAEAEAREAERLAAEEAKRNEERRQAEERARADAATRERARKAAEEEVRQQAEAKAEKELAPNKSSVEVHSPDREQPADETPLRPPTYQPTAPSPTTAPSRSPRPARSRTAQTSNADLRLRVQLVFGRGGVVRSLALAPDRRDGMPGEIDLAGTQGDLHLTELREDCYEPVALPDAASALLQGVEWRGRGDARRWRWVLVGRELYVLAPGDEFGLHGFVSTARLWLNSRHVVLAKERLRDQVLAALAQAGCDTPEISDETVLGVPPGWLLFRDVIPTRSVPMCDERDILNALCPAHEIESHIAGGIKVGRNTWLVGYPPRIRFTGEFASNFEVKIDGQLAERASDGAFEAPGWDSEGEHRLWFGDQAETYSLCTMDEKWEHWHAHDFGTGATICGAGTCQLDAARCRQFRVPVTNPLLIGARPGEIFCCHVRGDVHCETMLAMVSFEPVWALPLDAAHVDKQAARIMLLHPREPQDEIRAPTSKHTANRKLLAWIAAVRDAGCKGLRLTPEDEQSKLLWQRYRAIARQLRRKLR